MIYSRFLSACIVSTSIATIALASPVFANPAVDRIAAEITVRIEGPQGGSGLILAVDNGVYYILTNAHVVSQSGDYTIITPDEQRYLVESTGSVQMPGEDVAVLAFRSTTPYATAQIGDPDAVNVGDPVYVAGWPRSGGSLGQRIFVNTEGELTTLVPGVSPIDFPLHYTNIVRVGMSGGPVLNQRGEAIGINRLVRLAGDRDNRIIGGGVKIDRILSWWETAQKPIPSDLEPVATVATQPDLPGTPAPGKLPESASPAPSVTPPETPAPAPVSPPKPVATVPVSVSGGGYKLAQTLQMDRGFLGAVAIAALPSSRVVSGHSDGAIAIWDMETGEPVRQIEAHQSAVNAIAITPDGQTLISGSDDREIKIWDLGSGELKTTLRGHKDTVSALAIAPDGQTLVSGSWDTQINIWNLKTGELVETLSGHEALISSLAITPNGKQLISGSQDTTIRVWDLNNFQLVKTLNGHQLSVLSLAISQDSQTLASGGGKGKIYLWNLSTGQLTHTFSGHTDGVWSVVLAPDGKTLMSGSWDKTVRLWDLSARELEATLKHHADYVISLALSQDGKTLVSGGLDNQILIWKRQAR
ncbi:trypsin-like peptidase domain-containing protein [Roseofilum casamattae]|uniref:Trypsin-like peptidase domain-containing protein n=1 Tax=Roseofilum casamattae BLCC-M143 TaxID=3022442 RepID=A0ABT7C1U6_9CYAN|nr:trypsin-like peptidase domain-containing protein [Roseofilum casamattae]MDJ1185427.1 trypsin-like peptidase domain-containing protein [Roseofilum casamattae BLCC-M143]